MAAPWFIEGVNDTLLGQDESYKSLASVPSLQVPELRRENLAFGEHGNVFKDSWPGCFTLGVTSDIEFGDVESAQFLRLELEEYRCKIEEFVKET